jgi:hypothetical protein
MIIYMTYVWYNLQLIVMLNITVVKSFVGFLFYLCKDLDNHYIKLFLIFKPFVNLEFTIPNNKLS